MTRSSACPPADQLSSLLQGRLTPAEVEVLATHLETCPHCSRAAQSQPGDTLEPRLRGAAEPENGPTLSHLIARVKALSSDVPRHMTPVLRPPRQPGEIGRLGGYRILQLLGQGGMGMVYLAEDLRLKRRVALKVMLPQYAAVTSYRDRFLREGEIAAAIECDHIVTIYQVDEDQGTLFLAMQLLKGESLLDHLKHENRLPVDEAVRIGREIALGLAAAHERGLIHRDIKPANIWLEAGGGRVKILDFGLARPVVNSANLTLSGMIIGTPAYMAPEQTDGQANPRSDLFSLGCVLYEMTTGKQAFPGTTTLDVLANLIDCSPTPPRLLNPAIHAPLSECIMKLLAKDPARRPPSAAAVAHGLASLPLAAPTPRARRRLAWVVVALALLLTGGYAVYQILYRNPEGTRVVDVAGVGKRETPKTVDRDREVAEWRNRSREDHRSASAIRRPRRSTRTSRCRRSRSSWSAFGSKRRA